METQTKKATTLMLVGVLLVAGISLQIVPFDLGNALQNTWEKFTDNLSKVLEGVKDAIEQTPNPLQFLYRLIGGVVAQLSLFIVGAVQDVFSFLIGLTSNIFGKVFGSIIDAISNAFSGVISPLQSVADALSSAIQSLVQAFDNAFRAIVKALSGGAVARFAEVVAGEALAASGLLIYFFGNKIPLVSRLPLVNKVLPILAWILMGIGTVLAFYAITQAFASVILGALAVAVLMGIVLWMIYNLFTK